jgi:hypothetical protein
MPQRSLHSGDNNEDFQRGQGARSRRHRRLSSHRVREYGVRARRETRLLPIEYA